MFDAGERVVEVVEELPPFEAFPIKAQQVLGRTLETSGQRHVPSQPSGPARCGSASGSGDRGRHHRAARREGTSLRIRRRQKRKRVSPPGSTPKTTVADRG